MLHPKNEDWITIDAGFGYTLKSGYYFKEGGGCIDNQKNGGYFFKAGARNGLTTDHHEGHPFWGLSLIVSKVQESVVTNHCLPGHSGDLVVSNSTVFGGLAEVGYSFNISKKAPLSKVFLDLGIRAGVPFYESNPFLASRNYIPGIGFGKVGNRGININPVIKFRLELAHGKYGYRKQRMIKHK